MSGHYFWEGWFGVKHCVLECGYWYRIFWYIEWGIRKARILKKNVSRHHELEKQSEFVAPDFNVTMESKKKELILMKDPCKKHSRLYMSCSFILWMSSPKMLWRWWEVPQYKLSTCWAMGEKDDYSAVPTCVYWSSESNNYWIDVKTECLPWWPQLCRLTQIWCHCCDQQWNE